MRPAPGRSFWVTKGGFEGPGNHTKRRYHCSFLLTFVARKCEQTCSPKSVQIQHAYLLPFLFRVHSDAGVGLKFVHSDAGDCKVIDVQVAVCVAWTALQYMHAACTCVCVYACALHRQTHTHAALHCALSWIRPDHQLKNPSACMSGTSCSRHPRPLFVCSLFRSLSQCVEMSSQWLLQHSCLIWYNSCR